MTILKSEILGLGFAGGGYTPASFNLRASERDVVLLPGETTSITVSATNNDRCVSKQDVTVTYTHIVEGVTYTEEAYIPITITVATSYTSLTEEYVVVIPPGGMYPAPFSYTNDGSGASGCSFWVKVIPLQQR